ncbi:oxidoreductase [Sulfodiicoccus acidiphilus]|uniref:Oxidoreductase n=1 Tax=Sulfodiicoccus acidiphilus TaxID=1670455 RepID=A0A348B5K4_9CREN|nr:NAD(P)-dependent alcohol dehydrogenase [Sulfodiicoccus acidiphilus]BBD73456.1 oxidoreductase [Sulfodiicoccus acidiphilus]GGT92978.1 oxidoreductase [Sulfodiicoccus acidiphilus]
MKAVQLVAYGKPLEIREVPTPEPVGENVLVRIGGAGLCHSDLHIMEGKIPILPYLPFTLGHENAGYVEKVGPNVKGFNVGDKVAVYGGWSEKVDRFVLKGEENLSDVTKWVGIGKPGGYAEYLLVPSYRYLLPLGNLDPVEAAPLTDAGLTPYRAIKKLLPHLYPDSTVVIIGAGGLGQFGVRYAKLLTPEVNVVTVDVNRRKLEIARELGSDYVVDSTEKDPVKEVKELTGGEGAQGVVDFVGSDVTMNQAYAMAGRQGTVVIVGLAGGTLKFSAGTVNEVSVTTSNWGTQLELSEVLALARRGVIKARVERIGFEQVNETFERLAKGEVEGRAVLVPELP